MIAEQAAPICVSNAQLIVSRFSIKLGEVDHNSSFSDRNGLFLIVTVWVVARIVRRGYYPTFNYKGGFRGGGSCDVDKIRVIEGASGSRTKSLQNSDVYVQQFIPVVTCCSIKEIVPWQVGFEEPLDVAATSKRIASHQQPTIASSDYEVLLEFVFLYVSYFVVGKINLSVRVVKKSQVVPK